MNNQTTTTKMMTQRIVVWCLTMTLLCSLVVMPGRAQTQDRTARNTNRTELQARGGNRIVNSFRTEAGQEPARPLWVERAVRRSLAHLAARQTSPRPQTEAETRDNAATTLRNPQSELKLVAAEQDDLGQTHVRMNQVQKGVEVFGGQLIAHLESDAVRDVSGSVFDAATVEMTPTLPAEQAIVLAKAALHYNGAFDAEPSATLVVLPNSFSQGEDAPGATLTWQVTLKVETGTAKPGHYQYFVNAQNGQIVWQYNSLPHQNTTTPTKTKGYSLYSGTVNIDAVKEQNAIQRAFGTGFLAMIDAERGGSFTKNMNDQETGGSVVSYFFTSLSSLTWGNGTTQDRNTAAVDAHFGLANVWDYYNNTFGRSGIDGNGTAVESRVHFKLNENNAYYNGEALVYGDGDGVYAKPWVSIDIVGHEFTHGVTAKTAGLVYANESGALNESFSDIFGTAAERYSKINPDYLIGEDVMVNSGALRDMADPTKYGHPDHYTKRKYAGPCVPNFDPNSSGYNDGCGVHTNSSIMNKAFYLLAKGGTHPYSKITTNDIGPQVAERIFYRALTMYLTKNAKFVDARRATIRAAKDMYGIYYPWIAQNVAQAWDAVGVGEPISAGTYTVQTKHSGRLMDVEGVSTANGAQVHQWESWGGDNQKWQIESVGNGFYRLKARHSGKVLDVRNASQSNGGLFQQLDDGGTANQRFQIAPAGDGYYMIVARHSGKVLDVEGALQGNGARLHQWDYWGGDNQKWKLAPVQ
jgi:bacillolysin